MPQENRVFRVIVLTAPTVAFPFPGYPEINFIARVHDDHMPPVTHPGPDGYDPMDDKWWHGDRIVSVVLGSVPSLPVIGDAVDVEEYPNYYGYKSQSEISRLCLESRIR